MKVAAVIPAAGQSKRLKMRKLKPFVTMAGKPLVVHTLLNLKASYLFTEILLVVKPSKKKAMERLLARYHLSDVRLVDGGKTRAESVRNGFSNTSKKSDWILVHDVARPLVNRRLVRRLLAEAKATGAAICALPITDTVKQTESGHRYIRETLDRRRCYLAQTPQVFRRDLLEAQYRKLGKKVYALTDEASLFDGSRVNVKIVPGDIGNIKITRAADLELFKFYQRRF